MSEQVVQRVSSGQVENVEPPCASMGPETHKSVRAPAFGNKLGSASSRLPTPTHYLQLSASSAVPYLAVSVMTRAPPEASAPSNCIPAWDAGDEGEEEEGSKVMSRNAPKMKKEKKMRGLASHLQGRASRRVSRRLPAVLRLLRYAPGE